MMPQAASYSVIETLRNGSRVAIRAQRPDDRADMLAAVGRLSLQSRSRRFFTPKRELSQQEVKYFSEIDFVNHVALVAVTEDGGKQMIVGGGRYVVCKPGTAELAFAVIDQYQGQGIGAALLRHLIAIARRAKLEILLAEVLAENTAMLKVFESSGCPVGKRREGGVVHVSLQLL
jgi:ribosomal protein S18 acetylase RimI-like enzyme